MLDELKVDAIKKRYPLGTRIRLIHMEDEYPVEPGSYGTVTYIDSVGTLHMSWDSGRGLGITVDTDQFEVVHNFMKLRIYQMNLDRCAEHAFESYSDVSSCIAPDWYDLVWSGHMSVDTNVEPLECVFINFNNFFLMDELCFRGRSLSTSDIVEVVESDVCEPGFYYCDSVGFVKISFDPAEVHRPLVRVVVCEPGKMSRVEQILPYSYCIQRIVRGTPEYLPPKDFSTAKGITVIRNANAEELGFEQCRGIPSGCGVIYDIAYGPIILTKRDENGNLKDLTPNEVRVLEAVFLLPEKISLVDGSLVSTVDI